MSEFDPPTFGTFHRAYHISSDSNMIWSSTFVSHIRKKVMIPPSGSLLAPSAAKRPEAWTFLCLKSRREELVAQLGIKPLSPTLVRQESAEMWKPMLLNWI